MTLVEAIAAAGLITTGIGMVSGLIVVVHRNGRFIEAQQATATRLETLINTKSDAAQNERQDIITRINKLNGAVAENTKRSIENATAIAIHHGGSSAGRSRVTYERH